MSNNRSDEILMMLLSAKPAEFAGRSGAAVERRTAGLPSLDQRIDMFARAVFGPDVTVTPEMRRLARARILTAMAADLADVTGDGTAEIHAADEIGQGAYAAPVAAERAQRGGGWRALIASLTASLTVPRLAMAAVPLMLLIVAGSVLTQNWTGGGPAQREAPSTPPKMRGLEAPRADTAAERSLQQAIAAEEAAHGPNTAVLARHLVGLAAIYRADRRYAQAQALCERALIIDDIVLGPNNPETLRVIKELATIYTAQGHTEEAKDILSRLNQP